MPVSISRLTTFAGASLLSICVVACGNTAPDEATRLARAPDATFRTLDGQALPLRGLGAPVLVNFWATSCAICLHEMPALAALRDDYTQTGFELIAVAMPYDPPHRVLEMAEERQWPFPVALDIDGTVLDQFPSVIGTPTSFLFDASGRRVGRYVGAIDLPALRATLDELTGGA